MKEHKNYQQNEESPELSKYEKMIEIYKDALTSFWEYLTIENDNEDGNENQKKSPVYLLLIMLIKLTMKILELLSKGEDMSLTEEMELEQHMENFKELINELSEIMYSNQRKREKEKLALKNKKEKEIQQQLMELQRGYGRGAA